MDNKTNLPPVTPERIERLRLRVSLQTLSTLSGIAMTVLSEAERGLRGLTDEQEATRGAVLEQLRRERVLNADGK
jgi:hypothetical protein